MRDALRLDRSALVAALVTAAIALLTSPLLAVWWLVFGTAVAAVCLLLLRWVPPVRLVLFAAAGLVAGVVPYFVLAVVSAAFGDPSSGSGGGS